MKLNKLYKKLPVRQQARFRSFAEKAFYTFNLITLGQALLHPVGKVKTSFLVRPFLKKSVAQQGEDLILDRILSRLLELDLDEPGVVVDVGAYHPVDHSVTYLLYKRGWHGIAFDPSTTTRDSFKIWRPRDTFVCKAVGETDDVDVSFFVPKNASNQSLTNTKYPQKSDDYKEIIVRQVNLNAELKRQNVSSIDVLNIDIEGAELEVLKTFDFELFRPKVVAIEIHGNDIQKALKTEEAKILLDKGYRCSGCAVITYFFVRDEAIPRFE